MVRKSSSNEEGGCRRLLAPFLFLTLLALMSAVAGCGGATTGSSRAAPDFSGTTLEGQVVSLAGYAGKPLVLAFWASW